MTEGGDRRSRAVEVVSGKVGDLVRTARSSATLHLHVALAACAYIPLLLTRPGWISADTKTYFYLDPAKLLSRAWSIWDPSIGLGTVTHQNIGFLWPMGPFYWLMETIGVPDWAAQRLWWGSIIFIAGAGVAYLLRTLGWKGPAVTAATFLYAFAPYVLTLISRLSGLLLPFAALGWLLAFTILAVRHRGWRYPALFALAVATFGSVNATALILVGLAPVLWLVHSVWGAREATPKQAALAGLKIGVLTVPVSAWWIAGLTVQSTHGIRILDYTETAAVVSEVSVSHEVLRSLGYWFFYGGDRLGNWIEPSVAYTQWVPLLALTYLIAMSGLVGAAVSRWRHRAYFVGLILVGLVLAVGAHPWGGGSLMSRGFEVFLQSEVGLAMRSLPRAAPLVTLGLTVLLASGVASVTRRWPRLARPAGPALAVVAILALPPLWLGQFVPDNLRREEELPGYWVEAAEHLDAQAHDTRALVIPGSDFASYRWGNTVDPVLPGLIDRPSVHRELIPYGSPASANLVNALDLGLQERTASPEAIAPIARLMRAGDVLVVSDFQYERYNTPRPRQFWDFMSRVGGLEEPVAFGPGEPNETIEDVQLYDELYFATDEGLENPPELAVFPVEDPLPIVDAQPAENPVLVAGDGYGLVDAAALGLIDGSELIRYSAEMDSDDIASDLDRDAALLLTDTNRKRGERWTTVRHTRGYTEGADNGLLEDDLSDNRLPVFEDDDPDTQTVTVNRSGIDATATSYGNPISFTAEERPAMALDGDPLTAWRTAAFSDARGEKLEVTLLEPVTTDQITLQQPDSGTITRQITEARLTFDDGESVDISLDEESLGAAGQTFTLPEELTFETLTIEILADSAGEVPNYDDESSVGFSQVIIGDDMPEIEEAVRLPSDLLDSAGPDSIDHPLAISLNRLRQDPTEVTRGDEEDYLHRIFTLPSERSFTLSGWASVSLRSEGHIRDEVLGRPHDGSVPWARASTKLTGSPYDASAAFDGDDDTAWATVRSRPHNQWIETVLPEPETIDSLPVTFVTDGEHSVPTEVELWVDGEPLGTFDVGEIPLETEEGATTVTLDLDDLDVSDNAEGVVDAGEVTGSQLRLRFTGVTENLTNDWVSDSEVAQPLAVAEIDLPEAQVPELDETFDSGCLDEHMTLNGGPLPIRISGPMEDAVAGQPLTVETCDGEPLDLEGGEVEIESRSGLASGYNIDELLLRSAAGGEASTGDGTVRDEAAGGPEGDAATTADDAADTVPEVEVVSSSHDQMSLSVTGAEPDTPFWLVLGQSYNNGWKASIDGESLGEPSLVDGFANGWQVRPMAESFEVDVSFAPQQQVTVALWVSLFSALGCIVLAFRRPTPAYVAPSSMPEPYSPVLAYRYHGALPVRRTAVLAGLLVGAAAAATAGGAIGLVSGLATGFGTRHEKFRRWLVLASPVALGVAAAYVLQTQIRHSPPATFDWPVQMDAAHPFGWLAVWLLVADVVVGRLWQARSSEQGDHE